MAADTAALLAESWFLTVESAAVIWLRLGKLALFDAAALAESERMLGEKVTAVIEHSSRLMSGRLGSAPHSVARESVAFYRKEVAANRRRLSSPARTSR